LLSVLEKYIEDENVMWLLSNVIGSFCSKQAKVLDCFAPLAKTQTKFVSDDRKTLVFHCLRERSVAIHDVTHKIGLPLGNLTSQLFANVYMNVFDQFVKHKIKAKYYIRYADDFVFLSHDRKYLEKLLPTISGFLLSTLKLSLHSDKVFIKTLSSGVDFLGWVYFPFCRVLRTTTKRRMFRNIESKDGKEETVQSYLGLISHGNSWKLRQKI